MSPRKEKIREGLEIDFDLLDSDMVRWYMQQGIGWSHVSPPLLAWMHYVDNDNWTEGMELECAVWTRTLDDDREMAEGRRMLRLVRYKSYGCLAELAARPPEPGEFVIRMPPNLGYPKYVCKVEEARMAPGLGDPDSVGFAQVDTGFWVTWDFAEAQRFSHAEAIRLTIRIMEVQGCDIPCPDGQYYEPIRADIAEVLHFRAKNRPRLPRPFYAMLNDLAREP
jgi:hypothetical protein